MKKLLLILTLTFLTSLLFTTKAHAIEYPLNKPNNKIGIHILFDHELIPAAKLINSNGGDWGYVTIPIQAGDKDRVKWQKFMDTAKQYHVIPIVRLATEGDYFNNQVWRKPTSYDVIDFANFLNSLDWPVKNRYVIMFNEVNRADEWGGEANPAEYAELLSFAVTTFKSKTPDFFVISAGLDNAAPSQIPKFYNQYDYLRKMDAAVPGIFTQIDGLSSHSYPNPGFAQAPNTTSLMGVGSFFHEKQLTKTLSRKDLPVFITETGWSSEAVSDNLQLTYYEQTLDTIWNDDSIVAITPFLLQGSGGPFQKFSLTDASGNFSKIYSLIQNLAKIKGLPTLPASVLAAETSNPATNPNPPIRHFTTKKNPYPDVPVDAVILYSYKWLMHL